MAGVVTALEVGLDLDLEAFAQQLLLQNVLMAAALEGDHDHPSSCLYSAGSSCRYRLVVAAGL